MAIANFTPGSKACKKCLIDKLLGDFHKSSKGLYGHTSVCKECKKGYAAARYIANRDSILESTNRYYHMKKAPVREEKARLRALKISSDTKRCARCGADKSKSLFGKAACRPDGHRPYCKECSNADNKRYRETYPENAAASSRNWAKANPERRRAQADRWNKRNPGRATKLVVAWQKKKVLSDPIYRFIYQTRRKVYNSIKNMGYRKNGKTRDILGCDWEQFRRHVEMQFLKGMNWQNRSMWHLDHIIPLSEAKTYEDVVALNHFTNLRPIWAEDNLRKGSKRLHLI